MSSFGYQVEEQTSVPAVESLFSQATTPTKRTKSTKKAKRSQLRSEISGSRARPTPDRSPVKRVISKSKKTEWNPYLTDGEVYKISKSRQLAKKVGFISKNQEKPAVRKPLSRVTQSTSNTVCGSPSFDDDCIELLEKEKAAENQIESTLKKPGQRMKRTSVPCDERRPVWGVTTKNNVHTPPRSANTDTRKSVPGNKRDSARSALDDRTADLGPVLRKLMSRLSNVDAEVKSERRRREVLEARLEKTTLELEETKAMLKAKDAQNLGAGSPSPTDEFASVATSNSETRYDTAEMNSNHEIHNGDHQPPALLRAEACGPPKPNSFVSPPRHPPATEEEPLDLQRDSLPSPTGMARHPFSLGVVGPGTFAHQSDLAVNWGVSGGSTLSAQVGIAGVGGPPTGIEVQHCELGQWHAPSL